MTTKKYVSAPSASSLATFLSLRFDAFHAPVIDSHHGFPESIKKEIERERIEILIGLYAGRRSQLETDILSTFHSSTP